MEQRGFGAWRQRRQWVVFMVALVPFWSGASAQIRYSISEELKEGTVVGNIAKDLGIDRSTLKERGFRIVSGSTEPLFQVNQNDGILYVNRKIDREEVCERSNVCLINMKTVLENPLEVHYVAVEVLDVNDHSPSFPEKEKRLEIFESALPGARFQLQPARDPDGGIYSVQQYKLSHNDHFRLEVKDRGKDGKIPILNLQKPLDREALERHTLLLTAIDGDKPPKSGTIEILVDVLDVNDNMPVFTKESYSVTLNENSPIGTTVIQVNATDLDEGSNGEIMYYFGSNVNSKLRELFEVDAISGEIIVKEWIDFEIDDSYEIDIQASDKGSAPLTADKSVTVKIVDLNDNAPEIEVTSFSNAIPEDSRPGTTVALISVSDKDSVLNGKVLCSISDGDPFTLTLSSQDNMYSVVTKSTLDREKQSEYDLTIVAKDAGQPSLSSVKTISVIISDVNDNSPEFSLSPYTFYVTENNDPGFSVFSVSASDRDINENALISYHIPRVGGTDNKLASFLNINSENGNTVALNSFDFETLKTFQFQVVATDSGTPSLSSNVTINVFILDQNDNAPVILYPVSANGSAEGVEEIPRNVNAGHLVSKVRAYDADIGYNGWLLFSLQEVTDHSLFALDRYTGQIRTLRSFTETDEADHKLIILVKDNGNVSLSATATVMINVVEPKEAFAASDVKSAVKDDEENSVTFYLIITLGSVSALFLISIIVLIIMQCSKTPDYSSKYLQDANYDGTLCHSIQYRSGDKRYMLVGPRMSIGSTIVPGSNGNTLVVPDHRRRASGEMRSETLRQDPRSRPQSLSHTQPRKLTPKVPNSDWRYSASLRTGMQSSVHMEESSVMQGAQGVLVQNWPTVSSAAGDAEGGETSPPMGAGVDSNSWQFRYGAGGPGGPPQHLKPGEIPPEAFIIPGSPAIISIRQQGGEDDKSDFITFGKKEEAKKKKKKKKEKKDKKDKGKDDDE
ncbi:protocadherin alpha-7-like isoform X7 [Coregonus clupeaformis]|uniref:protocadherin alpha-7-like isoform X7 n=1 Tax=Coregonus clupeaformis TaxID=59861 RepID=UPI001E1C90F5|nr:protocadherin alpha-7-like isoform X7 [Coregonus clupeaformis]